jgi:UDP-xylose/UDP-N-acetylglucosamine transporter B4
VQFLFVASTSYFSQFDRQRPPFFLKKNQVPLRRWFLSIALFFTINVMNNNAFSYDISVPMHIILRSGGSVTTIVVGFLWGQRFTKLQVLSVMILTVGLVMAARADSVQKVPPPGLAWQ